MTEIKLKGNPIQTIGILPKTNTPAPQFTLTKTDLSDVTLDAYKGKTILLNIFPSLDTAVCAQSVRKFHEHAGKMDGVVVLCVSADLPFAHKRFCEAEGLDHVIPLSTFRQQEFGKQYGVTITTGPLTGLLSRAVVLIGKDGRVVYTEQVPEITQEPDYQKVLSLIA